jgi:antitoxin component YwqK of YwqJK toxin-antitoxin module
MLLQKIKEAIMEKLLSKIFCGVALTVACVCLTIAPIWGDTVVLPDGTEVSVTKIARNQAGIIISVRLDKPAYLNTSIGKLEFSTNRKIDFYENGNLRAGALSKAQLVNIPAGELSIAADKWIVFYESGELQSFFLSELQQIDTTLGKLKFNPNSKVSFYESGELKEGVIAENKLVNTDVGNFEVPSHWPISFHQNGNLEKIFLEKNQLVNTSAGELELAANHPISIYQNLDSKLYTRPSYISISTPLGLVTMRLDINPTISSGTEFYGNRRVEIFHFFEIRAVFRDKETFEAKYPVFFHKNGKLKRGFLSEIQLANTPIGSFRLVPNRQIEFYSGEQIKTVVVLVEHSVETSIGSFRLAATRPVCFYESGKLEKIFLSKPIDYETSVGLINIDEIIFYENGKLKAGRLSNERWMHSPIGRIRPVRERMVYFYENGELYIVNLKEGQNFNTPAGRLELNQIGFYKNGKIGWGILSEPQLFDTSVGNLKLGAIGFYENGKTQFALLAERTIIDGISFEADSFVGWDKNGKFVGEMQ